MLNARELATVLAALRYWQQNPDEDLIDGGQHFTEHSPLTPNEIDALCERLTFEAANPSIVICISGGAVQAVYASEAETAVTLIDWDANLEDHDLPGVVVFEHRYCRRAAYVSELTTDSLDSLEGGEAEKAIRAAQAKAG